MLSSGAACLLLAIIISNKAGSVGESTHQLADSDVGESTLWFGGSPLFSAATEDASTLRIVLLSNLQGVTTPCGCSKDQGGSLSRVATALPGIAKSPAGTTVAVAVGDNHLWRMPGIDVGTVGAASLRERFAAVDRMLALSGFSTRILSPRELAALQDHGEMRGVQGTTEGALAELNGVVAKVQVAQGLGGVPTEEPSTVVDVVFFCQPADGNDRALFSIRFGGHPATGCETAGVQLPLPSVGGGEVYVIDFLAVEDSATAALLLEARDIAAEVDRDIEFASFMSANEYVFVAIHRIRITPTLEQHPLVKVAAEEYAQLQRRDLSAIIKPTSQSEASCAKCHQQHTKVSSQHDRHMNAFSSLASVGAQDRWDCIGCHTTSERQFGTSKLATTLVQGVRCGACHVSADWHAYRLGTVPAGLPTKETCEKCHTANESPTFEFEVFKRKLVCTQCGRAGAE